MLKTAVRKEDLLGGMRVWNRRTRQEGKVIDRQCAHWCAVVRVDQRGGHSYEALWRVSDLEAS